MSESTIKQNNALLTQPTAKDSRSAEERVILHEALKSPDLREKHSDLLELAGLLPKPVKEVDDDIPPDPDANSLSSAKLEKLNRRSLKNAQKLAKLRALAGRKRRKSEATEKLQQVVQKELDAAFKAAEIEEFFRPVFEDVYLNFLLACSFEVRWSDEKKCQFASFSGFSLGECLAWIHDPARQGTRKVARDLKRLKTTAWSSGEVFLTASYDEDSLEALEVMAEGGYVEKAKSNLIGTVDLFHKNLSQFADEIAASSGIIVGKD